MIRSLYYIIIASFFALSCARNMSEKEQIAARDSSLAPQGAGGSESGGATPIMIDSSGASGERMPSASAVPIGALPRLPSAVLAQFHPNPKGFSRYRSLSYDSSARTESVAFFRAFDDSARLLRCIIADQDERTASTMIKEIVEIKARGYRDFPTNGVTIRAYYTEINGAPAIRGYNPSTKVATLNILCGDHRLVLMREDRARSADHLVEVAKTIDLNRLAEIVPQ